MDNIQVKTGKAQQDYWKLAIKKGFVKRGKIVARHGDILAWLNSELDWGMCMRTLSYYFYAFAQMIRKSVLNRKTEPTIQDMKNRSSFPFGNFLFPRLSRT